MMTAVSIVQHAAGVTPKMRGGGLLSFIKYDNRAISIALVAALFAIPASSTLSSTLQSNSLDF